MVTLFIHVGTFALKKKNDSIIIWLVKALDKSDKILTRGIIAQSEMDEWLTAIEHLLLHRGIKNITNI